MKLKTKHKLIIIVSVLSLSILGMYALFSFSALSTDPHSWSQDRRDAFVVIAFVLMLFVPVLTALASELLD